MSLQIRPEDNDPLSREFELSPIFIGREEEQSRFEFKLNKWKELMFIAELNDSFIKKAPSPNDKIQGLIVLLYGRGGFGKSTLLGRYHSLVLDGNQISSSRIQASDIIDWEFAVEGERGLFILPNAGDIDATNYYRLLCSQLAIALDKKPKDFGEYQSAVRDIENARKKAHNVLDNMQKDDRYAWLRGLTVETITGAIRAYFPPSTTILENPNVKAAASELAVMTQEKISLVRSKLHDKLGNQFGDYLNPSLRLGLALGRDLYKFSKNFPLLFFFDTYEEVDEGDHLLRIVMGAAGLRVGWVIAGRDNLWAGWDQRERSITMEYGYKDIVPSDRGLAIDFNAGGVGAFTPGDITNYFSQICEQMLSESPLPMITEQNAKSIYDVTQGVPLAVKIAAGLYVETASLKSVLENVDNKQNIIDQMVQRYLLHTRTNQDERTRLYGLALLRRSDQPLAIAGALGLSADQINTSYVSELSKLHRRYSFIFSEKDRPSLHQEVRYFLRLWLLKHRTQPEIISVNERLKEIHLKILLALEDSRQYTNLRERLEDEQWVATYLDLIEQQFWLDPIIGVQYTLPFIFVASVYRREASREAIEIGNFFENALIQPYRRSWEWAAQSLVYKNNRNPSHKELEALEELEKLIRERCPRFPQPL